MLRFFKKPFREKKDKNHMDNSIPASPKRLDPEQIKRQIPFVSPTPYENQQIVRGPKERFAGNLDFNLSQVVTKMGKYKPILEEFIIGSRSETRVVIAYLEDVANPGIVSEVKARLKSIRTKSVLDCSYIERNIEDSSLSPFPQVETTQNPVITQSALLQGRITIFVESCPDILLVPCTFFDLMDIPQDNFRRWFIASSFFRIARYIMFIFAAALPGFYIGLTSFNPELIPTRLAFLLAGNREANPFPIYFEAFMMMGVVEAVRMMLLNFPTTLGSAVAIVAGLALIGAGIHAEIIGPPITMIVTITIISSFGIPNADLRSSVRILQFFTMIMSTVLGIFGFAVSFFLLVGHLVNLKSFGIPYMTPLAPMEGSAWGHTVLRENTKEMPQDKSYKPK